MTLLQQKEDFFSSLIKAILKLKQITTLTDIQKKAFKEIESEANLVIIAPSGAGKSLIAELIALRSTLYERKKDGGENNTTRDYLNKKQYNESPSQKSIFLVPLRALAEEKTKDFLTTYKPFKLKVHLSMSDVDFNEEEILNSEIIISTYERFKVILNRIPRLLDFVENVVVDEFHLLGNKSRGETLETLLTHLVGKVRLVLLSATIANPAEIASWLHAKLLLSEKRLVPLEYTIVTTLTPENEIKKIIRENVRAQAQMLIFSGTRKKAEENAKEYADFIARQCYQFSKTFDRTEIRDYLERLALPKETPGNALIYELAQKGTAFHHAGLSREAKKAIEDLFKRKKIQVLFCTETLGAGVNLPAREVIILDTRRWNNEWLSRNIFHQIAGRAGRPGYDDYGKCTIFTSDQREKNAIIKRFWTRENKLKFDVVKSQITTLTTLEKMVIGVIYTSKPTFKELIEILGRSYFNFREENERKGKSGRAFFELLLRGKTTPEPFEELFQNLERKFQLENLQIVDQFEGENFQRITFRDGQEIVMLFLKGGIINCNCNGSKILCKHAFLVMQKMPRELRKKIFYKNYAILDRLVAEGYLKEIPGKRLTTTTKGTIMAELNVSKERFEMLRDWLIYTLQRKKTTITSLLIECLKKQPNLEEEIFGDNREFLQPIYEHIILRRDFKAILRKNELFEGDLFRVEMRLREFIAGLIPLAEFLGLLSLKERFEQLAFLLTDAIFNNQ